MRTKLLVLSAVTLLFAACGGNSETTETASTTAPAPAAGTKSAGEVLIAKSDCIGCHHTENKIIGPSYVDIAKKYEANKENIALLADKIVNGGKGVWGTVPMTPHPNVSEADAKEMVTYILSLKK